MRKNDFKILSLIGLAQRAGKVVSGEDTVQKECSRNRVQLLIVAEDSSENTKQNVEKWSRFYKIPFRIFSTRGDLGGGIGKEWRATIGISDIGFAKEIQRLFDEDAGE